MRRRQIRRLWLCGLALDVCVLATALDAREAGIEVHLLLGCTSPVSHGGRVQALERMRAAGVVIENG
jgi:nicotinamidase/pyrazinamidase